MTDVIVVGGGVIGLSVAYELVRRGKRVVILDQGALGQEASWAGAGMLPPGNPTQATLAEARLRAASHVLWRPLSERLREETGIDNGYRLCGGLELGTENSASRLTAEIHAWQTEGVSVEELDCHSLRALEPALGETITHGYHLPQMGQVRNPRHLKALTAACAAGGATFLPGTPVTGFERSAARITGVQTPAATLHADQYVICGGAWSRALMAGLGMNLPMQPVRGQMVLLSAQPLPFRRVLNEGSRYLVPRSDGRILAGSTEELAGFDKRNTAAGIGGLLELATRLVPALADARFEKAWAGLRPRGVDTLPYLGAVPELENLYIAAGHFRSGLQMSPITGVVLAQLMIGEQPAIPLDPYAVRRKPADDFSLRGHDEGVDPKACPVP